MALKMISKDCNGYTAMIHVDHFVFGRVFNTFEAVTTFLDRLDCYEDYVEINAGTDTIITVEYKDLHYFIDFDKLTIVLDENNRRVAKIGDRYLHHLALID